MDRSVVSRRNLVLFPVVFFGAYWIGNAIVRYVDRWYGCYCPVYWPVMMNPYVPTTLQVAGALVVGLAAWLGFRFLESVEYSLPAILGFGILSVLATNLLQGVHLGYRIPMVAGGRQYYNDALAIEDPWRFLRTFQEILPTLTEHSQTHPPGAVLLFYGLEKLLGSPLLISAAIGILSVSFLAVLMFGLLSTFLDRSTASLTTFLFVVFPATQIYSVASLDTIVGAVFLAALYFFVTRDDAVGYVMAAVCLLVASFLNYAFLFLLPVLAGYELMKRSSLKKTTTVFALVVLFYLLLFGASGFNYAETFTGAFIDDRPGDDPLYFGLSWYVPTRIQDVTCLVFFLGPFLAYLGWRGMAESSWREEDLAMLGMLGVFTILAVYAVGLYRDGVTSRNCFYVYPYLFFLVGLGFKPVRLTTRYRGLLFVLVFGQTLIMQIVANYTY